MNEKIERERNARDGFRLRPSAGRVVVKEDAFRYEGRIVIPDKVQRRPTTGVIIEVGEGVESYKIGDKVVYGLYSGTVIEFKHHPAYRILGVDEVLAVIEGQAELVGVGV